MPPGATTKLRSRLRPMRRPLPTYFSTLLIFFLFLVSSSEICVGSPEKTVPRTVQLVIFNAQKEIKNKDYAQAKKILLSYIGKKKNGVHPLVYYSLGNVYYLSGDYKKASQAYLKGYERNPLSFLICVNLARTYYELKEYRKAGDLFVKAHTVAEKPDDELLYEAGAAYFQGKEYLQARSALEKLVERQANVKKTWLKLFIYTCLELKDWQKAEHYIRFLLNRNRTDPDYWKLLAQVRIQQKDYRGGASAFEISYGLRPPKKGGWKGLADIYFYIDAPLKAVRCLEKAFGNRPSPKECDKLAKGYAEAHRLEKAIHYLNLAIKKKPSATRYLEMGKLYYQNGLWEKAIGVLRKSIVLEPDNGLANLLLGFCAWETGNVSLSRKAFTEAKKDKHYRSQANNALESIKEISLDLE